MTDTAARRRDKEKARHVDEDAVEVKHDKAPPPTRLKLFVAFAIAGLLLILVTTVKLDVGQSHEVLPLHSSSDVTGAKAIPLPLSPASQHASEPKRQQPPAQEDSKMEPLPPQSPQTSDKAITKSTQQQDQPAQGTSKNSLPAPPSALSALPTSAESEIKAPPAEAPQTQKEPSDQPVKPPAPANAPIPEDMLLSDGKPATSDVKGNLGPASVVTSPVVHDWLKDRWQAASDMQGTPIKGPHWVEVDLCSPAVVRSVKIDWEGAYATDYRIEGRLNPGDEWAVMVDATKTDVHQEQGSQPSKQGKKAHVYHHFQVPSTWPHARATHVQPTASCPESPEAVRYVRLYIEKPAKQWGASVWHFELLGGFLRSCEGGGAPCLAH